MTKKAVPPLADAAPTFRARIHLILDGGHAGGAAGVVYEGTLIALIVANVLAATLESVPSIRAEHRVFFGAFEVVSVALFTLEYALRLWSMVEDPRITRQGAFTGRLQFALSPLMLVDFFAIAPFYVTLFLPFIDLRVLRLFRLLRVLKIARYSPALTTLSHVIVSERRALLGTLILLLCVMIFAANVMHILEGEAQPKLFGTLPDSMWWAITTLTTVGYGDAIPITPLGKIAAGITMIMGLGLFALPVGIVATGFISEIHRRDFVVTWSMLSRLPLFEGLDVDTLGEVMNALRSQVVGADAPIAAPGENAQGMYFIVSGQAEVDHPEHGVKNLGPGDFFGEHELLHGEPHEARVTARTPARLLMLSAEDFKHLLRRLPKLKQRLEERAAKRRAPPKAK